jgi:hypothetical protein
MLMENTNVTSLQLDTARFATPQKNMARSTCEDSKRFENAFTGTYLDVR